MNDKDVALNADYNTMMWHYYITLVSFFKKINQY